MTTKTTKKKAAKAQPVRDRDAPEMWYLSELDVYTIRTALNILVHGPFDKTTHGIARTAHLDRANKLLELFFNYEIKYRPRS